MLLVAFLFAVRSEETNCTAYTDVTCLRCIDLGCGYCFNTKSCYNMTTQAPEGCDKCESRTKQCVKELGGDASDSVRYAIGFTILGISIVIDLLIRFLSRRSNQVDYAHL